MLHNILQDLTDDEFKRFKWSLRDMSTIPWCKLDKADRPETVDLMRSCDRQEAVNRTRESLGEIPRNDLVELLTQGQFLIQFDTMATAPHPSSGRSLPPTPPVTSVCPTADQVKRQRSSLHSNKAAGPDGGCPGVLKACAPQLCGRITAKAAKPYRRCILLLLRLHLFTTVLIVFDGIVVDAVERAAVFQQRFLDTVDVHADDQAHLGFDVWKINHLSTFCTDGWHSMVHKLGLASLHTFYLEPIFHISHPHFFLSHSNTALTLRFTEELIGLPTSDKNVKEKSGDVQQRREKYSPNDENHCLTTKSKTKNPQSDQRTGLQPQDYCHSTIEDSVCTAKTLAWCYETEQKRVKGVTMAVPFAEMSIGKKMELLSSVRVSLFVFLHQKDVKRRQEQQTEPDINTSVSSRPLLLNADKNRNPLKSQPALFQSLPNTVQSEGISSQQQQQEQQQERYFGVGHSELQHRDSTGNSQTLPAAQRAEQSCSRVVNDSRVPLKLQQTHCLTNSLLPAPLIKSTVIDRGYLSQVDSGSLTVDDDDPLDIITSRGEVPAAIKYRQQTVKRLVGWRWWTKHINLRCQRSLSN
ncbi:hypothetical protein FQN60_016199 [Etheostoma spectabile]|uniref:Pyrin domain-containing protein n=1 Tax=Etheostoma spectabile TaxID=54343 RepID=A0A5J5D068_9PERO|nr:hypothetical protein FQN60_016199 [Etheostoma spectabile]